MYNHTDRFLSKSNESPMLAYDFAKGLSRAMRRDADEEMFGGFMPVPQLLSGELTVLVWPYDDFSSFISGVGLKNTPEIREGR